MSKEQRYTLKLIIIGIAVFFAVASVPVLIFTKDKFKCEAGLFIGSVMAILTAISAGICPPIGNPIGAWILLSCSSLKPSPSNFSLVSFTLFLLPHQ